MADNVQYYNKDVKQTRVAVYAAVDSIWSNITISIVLCVLSTIIFIIAIILYAYNGFNLGFVSFFIISLKNFFTSVFCSGVRSYG